MTTPRYYSVNGQLFAQAGNTSCTDSSYGASTYNNACGYNGVSTTTGADGNNAGNSPIDALANTGYDILIPAALAISVVGASLVMFIRQMIQSRKNR